MKQSRFLSVLVVDNDENIRRMLEVSLKDLGCNVTPAGSGADVESLLRCESFDVLLTDINMSGPTGIDLLNYSRTLEYSPIFIVITASGSMEISDNAIREWTFDYLPKPFSMVQLAHLIRKVRTVVELKSENERLKKGMVRPNFFSGMTSPTMIRLQEFIGRAAPTDATILLVGENGAGKSELARIIRARSSRAMQPFVIFNRGTLTDSHLESELFGHVKGAFAGAMRDFAGKLEVANNGTLFIEEIGDLPVAAQHRLLRFLQERVIERVGSGKSIPLDVRVIAATSRNLEEAVKFGTFREDLYFRLGFSKCTLAPLRFRQEDLPVLIQRLLLEISALSSPPCYVRELPAAVMKLLLDYSWPGNIRELRNTIERIVALSVDREIAEEDLPDAIRQRSSQTRPVANASPLSGIDDLRTLKDLERAHIERILSVVDSQERAAEILGITTVTLWRKRKQYELP
jgi:DNA-binding NtrC family response regulator